MSDSWFYKQVTPAVMSALLGYPSERRRLRRAEALTVSEGTVSKHSGSVLTELDPPLPDSTNHRVLAVPAHLWGQSTRQGRRAAHRTRSSSAEPPAPGGRRASRKRPYAPSLFISSAVIHRPVPPATRATRRPSSSRCMSWACKPSASMPRSRGTWWRRTARSADRQKRVTVRDTVHESALSVTFRSATK
ncbi:hypothetical protein [Streptomyces sp. NBC_00151]|uniref:hypothetical protein n=1 Tax=Streptomyces sp. NBC_00151 TaxID=2975669 RepID=UPI002DDAE880|nr:hypothetical protein [Streptomyces sp. NBC_00151]WRZ43543.1 hypothetical protein OG915_39170 [Streptomyces sp. NBC_00151]